MQFLTNPTMENQVIYAFPIFLAHVTTAKIKSLSNIQFSGLFSHIFS